MNGNNYPQNNNNKFYGNNQQAPSPWGAPQQQQPWQQQQTQPPRQPQPQPQYYGGVRERQEDSGSSSSLIPILIVVIVVLLIAICLVGGYLFGRSKGPNSGNNDQFAASVQTTAADTEPAVTEAPAETTVTETAAPTTEAATEATTKPATEAPTTVQTSVVVSVKVVTEAPKTIFVGDYVCDVRVATKQTDLNLREAPSTSAKIIGSIPKDTIVPYYGSEASWGIVFYNGKYGYVNTAYISYDLYPTNNTPVYVAPTVSYATVNANGGLNLRAAESTSSNIVTLIPNGSEVVVYSSYDGWSNVSWNGNYGYVKSEYLKFK